MEILGGGIHPVDTWSRETCFQLRLPSRPRLFVYPNLFFLWKWVNYAGFSIMVSVENLGGKGQQRLAGGRRDRHSR